MYDTLARPTAQSLIKATEVREYSVTAADATLVEVAAAETVSVGKVARPTDQSETKAEVVSGGSVIVALAEVAIAPEAVIEIDARPTAQSLINAVLVIGGSVIAALAASDTEPEAVSGGRLIAPCIGLPKTALLLDVSGGNVASPYDQSLTNADDVSEGSAARPTAQSLTKADDVIGGSVTAALAASLCESALADVSGGRLTADDA